MALRAGAKRSISRKERLKRIKKKTPEIRPSKRRNVKRQPYLDPSLWTGKLKGVPCFILGNAPSINKIKNISLLDDYFTIGINRIFFTYDPTILIWQDLALWTQEKKKVLKTKAIKYCREGSGIKEGFYGFKLNGREAKLSHNVSTLYGRGSSGSISYQFAHALGCNPIMLVGMDCRNKDGKTDFYGVNSMHRAHTLPDCVKGLKFIKKNSGGRTIINCSKNKVFPERMSIEEVIATLGEKKYSRGELEGILFS